jgi:hypothetical protein
MAKVAAIARQMDSFMATGSSSSSLRNRRLVFAPYKVQNKSNAIEIANRTCVHGGRQRSGSASDVELVTERCLRRSVACRKDLLSVGV